MSEFLEKLKLRMVDAQKRHLLAQQRLQFAQAEFNAATRDYASWQNALRIETAKEQQEANKPQEVPPPPPAAAPHVETPQAGESNKTDAVRQIMHNHPAGISPSDIWKELKGQINYRPYMYSILKRLSDRNEIVKRRGKYFLKVDLHPEKDEGQASRLVQ
jgi:hypothetical protein